MYLSGICNDDTQQSSPKATNTAIYTFNYNLAIYSIIWYPSFRRAVAWQRLVSFSRRQLFQLNLHTGYLLTTKIYTNPLNSVDLDVPRKQIPAQYIFEDQCKLELRQQSRLHPCKCTCVVIKKVGKYANIKDAECTDRILSSLMQCILNINKKTFYHNYIWCAFVDFLTMLSLTKRKELTFCNEQRTFLVSTA